MKKFLCFLLILGSAVAFLSSCSGDDNDNPGGDANPIIGNWKLRAVVINGQSSDVTDAACFKESFLNFNSTSLTGHLSVQDQNTGECATSNLSYGWVNEEETYYIVENNRREAVDFRLNDDNQILQWNIPIEGTDAIFVYRK